MTSTCVLSSSVFSPTPSAAATPSRLTAPGTSKPSRTSATSASLFVVISTLRNSTGGRQRPPVDQLLTFVERSERRLRRRDLGLGEASEGAAEAPSDEDGGRSPPPGHIDCRMTSRAGNVT